MFDFDPPDTQKKKVKIRKGEKTHFLEWAAVHLCFFAVQSSGKRNQKKMGPCTNWEPTSKSGNLEKDEEEKDDDVSTLIETENVLVDHSETEDNFIYAKISAGFHDLLECLGDSLNRNDGLTQAVLLSNIGGCFSQTVVCSSLQYGHKDFEHIENRNPE